MNLAIGCLYLSFRKCAIFFNVCLLDKADFKNFETIFLSNHKNCFTASNFCATSCDQKSVLRYLSILTLPNVNQQL